jgi:Ca2+-binding EF-hand superfamily protein
VKVRARHCTKRLSIQARYSFVNLIEMENWLRRGIPMMKLTIVTAALMAGTAALAQTDPAPAPAPDAPQMKWREFADKEMTRDEVVAQVREHFTKLDGNKDGSVTKEEVMENAGKMGHRFEMKRGDGPHGSPMEAVRGDPSAAFDRLDANKDGSISRDEFAKGREQRIERRIVMHEQGKDGAAGTPKDGKAVRKHVMRMHGGPGGFGSRMIILADTDKDGKITLAEAEALALQHFDKMDSNKDGKVTPEERRAGRPMIIKSIEEKKTAS